MYSHNKFLKPGTQANAGTAQFGARKRQSSNPFPPLQSTKILEQVRERVRNLHYSMRTEEAYLYWIRHFIRWAGVRHPRDMGADEVARLLVQMKDTPQSMARVL